MRKKKYVLIMIVLCILIIASCRGNQKPNPQDTGDNPKQIPKVLTEMEDKILEAMYSIDGIPGIMKAIEEKDQLMKEVTEESEVDLKRDEKQQAASEDIDINMFIADEAVIIPILKEEDIEADILKLNDVPNDADKQWYEIRQMISDIHVKWNLLEGQLVKAGISKEDINKFERFLDSATISVNTKEIHPSLVSLNELLYNLADFRGRFKDKVPLEVYKIRYHIRGIVLFASVENYPEANRHAEEIKRLLEGLRQRITEENGGEELQKMELALADVEQQLQAEDFQLLQIKASILMRNIITIEEIFQTP